jgi:hypothetical protein
MAGSASSRTTAILSTAPRSAAERDLSIVARSSAPPAIAADFQPISIRKS